MACMTGPAGDHGGLAQALEALGADVSTARRRRRWTMEHAATRAGLTRSTWARIERGAPEVSLGVLARALDAMGLLPLLASAADPGLDRAGLELEAGRLPLRVRRRRRERLWAGG